LASRRVPRPLTGARDRDTTCRIDLARCKTVDQGWRQDSNVERGTFVDLLLHCRRQAESEDKLVPGRLLELRAEFFEDRLHCGG
jgi:hypothetical protein